MKGLKSVLMRLFLCIWHMSLNFFYGSTSCWLSYDAGFRIFHIKPYLIWLVPHWISTLYWWKYSKFSSIGGSLVNWRRACILRGCLIKQNLERKKICWRYIINHPCICFIFWYQQEIQDGSPSNFAEATPISLTLLPSAIPKGTPLKVASCCAVSRRWPARQRTLFLCQLLRALMNLCWGTSGFPIAIK